MRYEREENRGGNGEAGIQTLLRKGMFLCELNVTRFWYSYQTYSTYMHRYHTWQLVHPTV